MKNSISCRLMTWACVECLVLLHRADITAEGHGGSRPLLRVFKTYFPVSIFSLTPLLSIPSKADDMAFSSDYMSGGGLG